MNKTEIPSAITVNYAFVDGAHFFTSTSPLAAGLCAASAVLKDAFDDVSVQLEQLVKENYNITAQFRAASSYESFVKDLLDALESEMTKRGGLLKRKTAPAKEPEDVFYSGASVRPSNMTYRAEILQAA